MEHWDKDWKVMFKRCRHGILINLHQNLSLESQCEYVITSSNDGAKSESDDLHNNYVCTIRSFYTR